MTKQTGKEVTRMLRLAAEGDSKAAGEVLPLVYKELRGLAESRLKRAAPGQTLQATALVHEAYLRLVGDNDPGWQGRGHFFFAAARAMRDILVERARSKATLKRGGGRRRVDVEKVTIAEDTPAEEMVALGDALERLKEKSPRQHNLVMLRFFAGLTIAEAAEVLDTSERTLRRDWSYIRARLHKELAELGTATGDQPGE